MWQGWVNGILGLWLIVASFTITGSKTGNCLNGLITGAVLIILGLWGAVSHRCWQGCAVAAIGAWMVVAGIWFPANYMGTVANDIAAGVAIAMISFSPGLSWALRGKRG